MSNCTTLKTPGYDEPKTLAALEDLFGASSGPSAHIISLHPRLASRLLRRNTANRNLRLATVADYVRDIQADTWPVNGEAIKIDYNGNVLDGQHRLHAVVKADRAVTTFIIGGLPPEAQSTMDSGMRRTTADALTLSHESNATTVAAVLRRVWCWEQGDRKFTRRTGPTTTESRALLDEHPEIRRAAEVALRTRAAFPHIPPSALGTAFYLFNAIDPGQAAWFFQRVGDGAELPTGHPILALRSHVTSDRAKEGRIDWSRHLAYLWTGRNGGNPRTPACRPRPWRSSRPTTPAPATRAAARPAGRGTSPTSPRLATRAPRA